MASRTESSRRPRTNIIGVTAIVVVVGLLTSLAVVAQGYDAQQVPRREPSVWVARDAGQYARVNTDLGEIDTVRTVDSPSDVVQAGSQGLVYSQGDRQLWPVDAANPVNLVAKSASTALPSAAPTAAAKNTPSGTRNVVSSGRYILYLTDIGKVYLATINGDGSNPNTASMTSPVDPFATVTAQTASYVATAVAVADDGQVALYSAAEGAIRRFDVTTGQFAGGVTKIARPPAKETRVELAMVGGKWVLSAPADKQVWIDGHPGAITTGLGSDARMQTSSSTGDRAYLADSHGLSSIDLGSGSVTKVARASGVPAAPTVVATTVYAAWLSANAGTLWSSETSKTIALKTQGSALDQVKSLTPIFRTNGQRAVLSEQASGLLWTVPNGTPIPISQWTLDDKQQSAGTVQVDDVAQEEPPVAVPDSFGVRHGALVALPVLLNDYDPNKKDVITIVPGSISAGLSDPSFGDLSLISNDQEAVVRVRAQSGSATFSYTVTDGTRMSPPATVTLTVVPDGTNTAPVWCGVQACVQKWPTPAVSAGGTTTVAALTGWVDPEGDPLVLSDARKVNPSDPVTVVPKSDGSIAIRHTDPNAPDSVIPITVTVSDALGATATKVLELTVTGSPTLIVPPVAIVAGVNEKTTLKIADHVSGGSGSFRLLDATSTSTSGSGLVVLPNVAAGQIDLTASTPGEYALTYSVQDAQTQAEQAAIIRFTVVGSGAPLAMAPLTAFVRANEDTTVAALDAVQNTTGRVLIVQSVVTGDPGLGASVVGQSAVRVSGSTTNGLPGRVGSAIVTVTDGAGSTVEGTLTVFLVASSTDIGPIAQPDTVTVRAGKQVDIPVLANDVSPRGERLVVSPDVKGSGAEGELAFVNGDYVRYLAPPKPGVYTLHYSDYLENQPGRLDTTTITVTVLPDGVNRPPQPRVLTARVLSGQTVSIPVDSYGMDPDGDPIVLVGVGQPKAGQGTVAISADGAAIRYSAPGNGVPSGQLSFDYTVRDSLGASATGVVRVGVLKTESADSAPITYSDYVRVQQSATSPVTVEPMLNDSDPAEGKLALVGLIPNAPTTPGNPEYARLASLIDTATSLKTGRVVLHAGAVLGTHSYIYTVQSSASSSTSQGLIVVTVSDRPSPDHPTVSDTVLTAKNRSELAGGIDVVTSKVQWPTGNISDLTLALWGKSASRYSVDGRKISGPLRKDGDVVAFSLIGTNAGGGRVTSYGFLRIPAFDDMRVQLATGVKPITVAEEKSGTIRAESMVDLASGDSIEVRHDSSFAVQRGNASCAPDTGTTAVYNAGREAPWSDSCAIPVRIVGQHEWTMLAVPVVIIPKNPQAQLTSVSRTVAPGATDTVQLYDAMTQWEGGRIGDRSRLDYVIAHTGAAFIVTQSGTTVTMVARADAKPGTRENIQVSVSAYGGLTANIALVVGVASPDAPRGATFRQQCDVSRGASCSVKVIGLSGEYDPFAGKVGAGLHLTSVGSGGSVTCAVATVVTAGDSQVTATWPAGAKPAGGECVVPFTVTDAQGRVGQGQLTIDVQGYPQRPASIANGTYDGTSVTMTVTLGEASQAHPGVTSVTIYEQGGRVNASCIAGTGSYLCTVSGLVNGANHSYTARAVNSIGESLDTTPLTTHAYAAPQITALTGATIFDPQRTSAAQGAVELHISSGSDVQSFRVVETNETITRTGDITTAEITLSTGSQNVTLVPMSQFQPPIGGVNVGGSRVTPVTVAGRPGFTGTPSAVAASDTTATITGVTLLSNSSAQPTSLTYIAWQRQSAEPVCSDSSGGGLTVSPGGSQSATSTVSNLTSNRIYGIKVCGTNQFGSAESSTYPDFYFAGTTPVTPPSGVSYTVSKTPTVSIDGSTYDYQVSAPPVASPPDGYQTWYTLYGNRTSTFVLRSNAGPTSPQLEYCSTVHLSHCSVPTTIAATTAPTIATVTFPTGCVSGTPAGSDIAVTGGALGSATRTASMNLAGTEVTYTLTWTAGGAFASLTSPPPVIRTMCPPKPTPTPTPTPTPAPTP